MQIHKDMKRMNLTIFDWFDHVYQFITNVDYRYAWENRKWPSGEFR